MSTSSNFKVEWTIDSVSYTKQKEEVMRKRGYFHSVSMVKNSNNTETQHSDSMNELLSIQRSI